MKPNQTYITDCAEPWAISATGDIEAADGEAMIKQRIIRLLFTSKGDIHHRPLVGADLQAWRGTIPTPVNIRRIQNDVEMCLETIPWIDTFKVHVSYKKMTFYLSIAAEVNGTQIALSEVAIV